MKKLISIIALTVVAFSVQAERSGEEVFTKSCTFCHASGVAGAPKVGDSAAWATRLEGGMDAAIATVKKGKGAMPATGMCGDCSDAEYKNAIDFMSK
ncbi:MAG: cytochrome c5 family protein [Pseudomonadales bacterium]|nr:cytochrome c5 family protein [Pseudomonadales bacterium]